MPSNRMNRENMKSYQLIADNETAKPFLYLI